MLNQGQAQPTGDLGLRVLRNDRPTLPSYRHVGTGLGRELTSAEIVRHSFPRKGLPEAVNDWRADNVALSLSRARKMVSARRVAQHNGLPYFWSQLWLTKITNGYRLNLGLASIRVVTTAGVNYLVDSLQGTVEPELLRFHGFGVGIVAEASGDTTLGTEETTQYNPDSTRPTGTLAEGASANIFRTVGTYTPDSGVNPRPITEHGVFSQAAVPGGTLLDRSVFAVVNLVPSADSLEATYELTLTAGG